MVEKRFNQLGMPDIERFENYLPTAFSSELTLLQKVNKIILDLIRNSELTNEMVEYLNNFIETFDENLYETVDDVLNEWLKNDKLAKFIRDLINEEVIEARTDYLGKKYVNLKERLDSEKADIVEVTNQLAHKADIVEVTNQLAHKANKDEVTNIMTPKGNKLYNSLPMTGNTIGDYYYSPDGDGVNGAGNYVWNGTAWYFGGTGDEGYNKLKSDLVVLSEQTKNLLDSDNITPDVLYENVLESWGEDDSWFYNWSNSYTYNVSKSKEVLYKGFPTLSVQLSNATGKDITINHRINLDDYINKEVYVELGLYVVGNSIPEMAQFGIGRTVLNFNNLKSGWNFVKGTIITPSNETNNKIRLVVEGNCHVYFSPVLITYNYFTRLTLGQTTQEMKKELNKLSNNLSTDYTPELIFPDAIPCVADKQIMIYYDNALLYSSIKNIERIKADRNKSPYDNMVDKWFWQPSSDDASFTNAFRMYTKNTKEYAQEARCWIQNVSKTSGSGKTKKCLFIGDSITQYGGYISELINLFENDEASIELLGTRESAYTDSDGTERTVRHEGRGGWSAKDYCTAESKNSVSNPFLYNGFNLAHYMVNQGYSSVDYVFVILGTNDLSNSISETVGYFTQIYNSIKGYDSNVKVFISLCPSLSSKVDTFDMKNKRLLLTKELIKEFGGKSESGTFLVPLYLVIDAENDFPNNESVYNATRFAKLPSYITDNTHMNKYGHYKMADLVYYTIKYAMQLFS